MVTESLMPTLHGVDAESCTVNCNLELETSFSTVDHAVDVTERVELEASSPEASFLKPTQ